MKYLCLVYLEEQKLHAVPDRECLACGDGACDATFENRCNCPEDCH